MKSPQIRIIALLGLSILFVAGCGSGAPPTATTSEEATVKGTVTINGKPATGGTITFDAANINRRNVPVAKSEIGKDGSYTVKTLVGENAVEVSGPDVTAAKIAMPRVAGVNVKSGENTIPIDLMP